MNVVSFSNSDAVKSFFGPASDEYSLSQIYFNGFENSTQKPGSILFAAYVTEARYAWLQSGSLEAVTLAQLKTLSGNLGVVVDGTSYISSDIDLSVATSFSHAASLITAGFTGANKPHCSWNAVNSTFILKSNSTGASSTLSYAAGSLAEELKLTRAAGAVLSQGLDADTPDSAMSRIKSKTDDWISFTTLWEPSLEDKKDFAVWNTSQGRRFVYSHWDTDSQAVVDGASGTFGAIAKSLSYEGVMSISGDASYAASQNVPLAILVRNTAAFVMGCIASIDFNRKDGRIDTAFKSQSGFIPTVGDSQKSENLLSNGYNFYGNYGIFNNTLNFLYNGQISGPLLWADNYIDDVYFNSLLQLSLIEYLTYINSSPYNQQGYDAIRAAMMDPINQAIYCGIIRSGVTLSSAQAYQINQASGVEAAPIVQRTGYYLQILDPGAQVRGQRGTPIINLWYTNGESINQLNPSSIDVL